MRLRTTMKSLELDLAANPENARAKEALERTMKELDWYERQVREGKDPGVMVL
jgi:hypothetical protein